MNPKWEVHKNQEYVAWIKTLPCVVCKKLDVDPHHCYNARRNDLLCIPLCREHHRKYHDHGADWFETTFNLSLDKEIIRHLTRFIGERSSLNGTR